MAKLQVLNSLVEMLSPGREEMLYSILLACLPAVAGMVICLWKGSKVTLNGLLLTLSIYIICEVGVSWMLKGETAGFIFLFPGLVAAAAFVGTFVAGLVVEIKLKIQVKKNK